MEMTKGQALIGELTDHCNAVDGWTAREWNRYGKARIYINADAYKDCKVYFEYADPAVAYTNTIDAYEDGWALDKGARIRVGHHNPRRRSEIKQDVLGTLTIPVMQWNPKQ